MIWEELAKLINKMTPEQQQCSAIVADSQTGETVEIENLISLSDFNGDDTDPDQMVIWLQD